LKKYGISPKQHRTDHGFFRGYSRAQFEDAWKRYLVDIPDDDEEDIPVCADLYKPEASAKGNLSDTSATSDTSPDGPVSAVSDVTDKNDPTRLCGCGAELSSDNPTDLCAECRVIRAQRIAHRLNGAGA
jgi:hypothetical protein